MYNLQECAHISNPMEDGLRRFPSGTIFVTPLSGSPYVKRGQMRIRAAKASFVGGMFKDAIEVLSMVSQTDLEIAERLFQENRIDYVVTGGLDQQDPICIRVKRSQAITAQNLVRRLKR